MTRGSGAARQARIQSLARANAILGALAELDRDATLGEIAGRVRLGKTTVCNILSTLVALEFVQQDRETRGYRLGLRNLELGRRVQARCDIASLCRPLVVRLCGITCETINLGIPGALDVLIIDSVEGTLGVRVTSYVGARAAYHSTSIGKAILAEMPTDLRQAIYAARPLRPATPATITQVDVLEAEIRHIQHRGFALDLEEDEQGTCCVGAAIRNRNCSVLGAISIAGPSYRMDRSTLDRLGTTLVAALASEAGAIAA